MLKSLSFLQLPGAKMPVRIQEHDFDLTQEIALLRKDEPQIGAVAIFIGTVRDLNEGSQVKAMTLEHYPGMTESSLEAIALEAGRRWPLTGVTIIHRIGELRAGDQIVFVATASAHRAAAFSACEFIMDYLKPRAPFWKKCLAEDGEFWVAAKDSDQAASERW